MLGWHVSIYRQKNGGATPATFESQQAERVAVWQAGLYGLNWINDLVRDGKAIDLGGDGYPVRYTAPAQYLVPQIVKGLPEAHAIWSHDEGDILNEKWAGKTVINVELAKRCDRSEWLLVEAWDES
jgi:hypothetical protein